MNEQTLRIVSALLKCSKVMESRLDSCLTSVDLTTTRLMTLQYIDKSSGPVALGAIAERMGFAKSNATQLVDNLEHARLVTRIPDSQDRRCTHVELTEQGKARCRPALDSIDPLVKHVESVLTQKERDQLESILEHLIEGLD